MFYRVRAAQDHHRQIVRQRVEKLKERDELEKQKKQSLMYTRRMMV